MIATLANTILKWTVE